MGIGGGIAPAAFCRGMGCMKSRDQRENSINRREFLGSSAKNAAGMAAVGMVGLASAVAAKGSPGERVSVAAIGIRGQGKDLASGLAGLPDVDLVAICDVDESLLPVASKAIEGVQGRAPRSERDFRRILDDPTIDAVVIATPDHWHAVMTILACQAGKDVYVEKPVSHNLREGERMIAAARKYGRVVQSGLQQRSGTHFQSAIEFVRSGKLGPVHLAKAWTMHVRKPIGHKKDGPVPQGVDYNLWLGPAAAREFNPNRFHYNWHWFWEYGTGELGNWGVHMLDVARWGLGVELPTQVTAAGGKHAFDDDQQTPDTLLVNYSYPGKTITWEHRLWSNHGIEGRSAAAAFYGEQGTLVVDRGGWKVYDQRDSATSGSSDLVTAHHRNFVDCIKSRQLPVADIEVGHVSSALCHLGNIAYRNGGTVTFDPAAMDFGAHAEANFALSREYRAPWELPTV
jgi:predicted dehydrogenase